MMLFGLVSCGFWIPLLAMAVLCCVVLYRSLSSAGVIAPQCGGCGYAVADIPGTTCPECGRSLLTTGVATRSLVGRYRSSMLQAQLAWLGVWGSVSIVASWLVWWIWLITTSGGMFAGGGAVAMTGTITPTGSATHGPVTVDVNAAAWGQTGTLVFRMTDADGVLHEVEFDGTAEPLSAIVWTDGMEVWSDLSTPISPAFDEWCAAAGIDDATDPDGQTRLDLDTYATTVVVTPMSADQSDWALNDSLLTVSSATGTTGQMVTTFGGGGGGMLWPVVAMLVVLIGYVVGVVLIVRRRSTIMRMV